MNTVIKTESLTMRFDETVALSELSLEVSAGEVFGLLGHNGSGKTTTVRLLNGILRPSAGKATVFGRSTAYEGEQIRQRTGVLTETPSLDERLTGRENLQIYASLFRLDSARGKERANELLVEFDLLDRADEKAGGYSKGMKQRLALARALIHRPDLLFLDEPTAALDPVAARHVHGLISKMRQSGRTVVLCTHNLAEAQELCDRVAVIARGKLVALGSPEELSRRLDTTGQVEIELAIESLPIAKRVAERAGLRLVEPVATDHRDGRAVGGASVENSRELLLTGAGRDGLPELLAAFVSEGARIYRFSPRSVSLEEVYFALNAQVGSRVAESVGARRPGEKSK